MRIALYFLLKKEVLLGNRYSPFRTILCTVDLQCTALLMPGPQMNGSNFTKLPTKLRFQTTCPMFHSFFSQLTFYCTCQYFHMYDSGGIDDSILSILKPYLRTGKMDIVEMSDNLKYDSWLYCQVLVVNDCSLRVRYKSQWAIMMDVDEYLHMSEVPHSLPSFLESLSHLPWITFGSQSYSTQICRDMVGLWGLRINFGMEFKTTFKMILIKCTLKIQLTNSKVKSQLSIQI